MPQKLETTDAIYSLLASIHRFKGLAFSKDVVNPLIDLAALVTLRQLFGENRPPLIGFIGCTGTGKSTLFNSLAGHPYSTTGWQVHNTLGPVLFTQAAVLKRIKGWELKLGPLLLPLLKRKTFFSEKNETFRPENLTSGAPDVLQIIGHREIGTPADSQPAKKACVLIDLPDINSSPALEEHLVALDIVPWLDIVIFMVDDETLFHQVYSQPVGLTNEFKQVRFCVMANRGRDHIDMDHPDLQQAKTFFGVDKIWVLPDLKERELYQGEPAFVALKKKIAQSTSASPQKPLIKRISRLAGIVIHENEKRQKVFAALDKSVSRVIQDARVKDAPISVRQILPDDTLHALNHLGLKRFAVSNLLHFLKNVATKGSLKQSFDLSFGSQRDEMLSQLLHFDREKLIDEVSNRLIDYRERIFLAIRNTPDLRRIQTLAPGLALKDDEDVKTRSSGALLQSIVEAFEKDCKDLLASDSVSAVIKNDPILTLVVIVTLIADTLILPGFGSWLLVPTAFKYLPLGKFEAAKKKFQTRVKDVIQSELMRTLEQLRLARNRSVLENDDMLMKSLNICSRYADGKE
jgi:hypothetical protein